MVSGPRYNYLSLHLPDVRDSTCYTSLQVNPKHSVSSSSGFREFWVRRSVEAWNSVKHVITYATVDSRATHRTFEYPYPFGISMQMWTHPHQVYTVGVCNQQNIKRITSKRDKPSNKNATGLYSTVYIHFTRNAEDAHTVQSYNGFSNRG